MNKKILKKIISAIYPFRYSKGVLILNYHSINPNHKYSTTPYDFDCQMKYLSENYQIIKLSDIAECDTFSLVITFDDGFADNYDYAFPILKKYNIPATIFLVSDFVFHGFDITKNWVPYKGLGSLTQENIKEMSDSGLIDFGSHGKSHEPASSLPEDIFKNNLIISVNEIERCSGKKVRSYAFPFGQRGQRGFYNSNFFKGIGLVNICSTDWGINKNVNSSGFLKRIRIDSDDTMDDFIGKIKGSWNFVAFFQYLKNLKWNLRKY